MKRILFILMSLFMTIILSSCNASKDTVTTKDNTDITQKCNIKIDPKVQLLEVVQYLANDDVIVKDNSSYCKAIEQYFSKYKDEKVVKTYKDMRQKGFSYHIPPQFMIYLDNEYNFRKDIPLAEDVINSGGGKEKLTKLKEELLEFKQKTNFDKFYESQTKYYKSIIDELKKNISKVDCISELVKYYGYNQNSFNIVIQPLSIGGYGVRISKGSDKFDVYDFMCLSNHDIECIMLMIHEFSHSYINPLTEKHIEDINKYIDLFEPIKENMTQKAYGTWEYCVNEHIVRACTAQLLDKLYGKKEREKYLNYEIKECGFIYVDEIYDVLEEYKNNRSKYRTFKEFYPRIITLFKDLAEKQ